MLFLNWQYQQIIRRYKNASRLFFLCPLNCTEIISLFYISLPFYILLNFVGQSRLDTTTFLLFQRFRFIYFAHLGTMFYFKYYTTTSKNCCTLTNYITTEKLRTNKYVEHLLPQNNQQSFFSFVISSCQVYCWLPEKKFSCVYAGHIFQSSSNQRYRTRHEFFSPLSNTKSVLLFSSTSRCENLL